LSGLFHFGTAPDLTLKHEDLIRGGAHRGTKDYPYLKERDAKVEQEEREGLVGRLAGAEDDDGDGDGSDGRAGDRDEVGSVEGSLREQGEVTEVTTAQTGQQIMGVRLLPSPPNAGGTGGRV
jgi:hypothetical protein